MGNNVIPYANMVGEKYTYFLYNRYKFIENDKIEEGTLLNATNNSLDPYDYHVEKCGVHSSEKLERRLVHTFSPDHGEDQDQDQNGSEKDEDEGHLIETNYTNGNNEVVKISNQKSVICYLKMKEVGLKQIILMGTMKWSLFQKSFTKS